MDPSERSCQADMNANESNSECESESSSILEIINGEMASDEFEKVKEFVIIKEERESLFHSEGFLSPETEDQTSNEPVDNKLEINEDYSDCLQETYSLSMETEDQTSNERVDNKLEINEDCSDCSEETYSLSMETEDQTSNERIDNKLEINEDCFDCPQEIYSLSIIDEEQTSEQNESRLNKEGHTLSNIDQPSEKKDESRSKEREDRPLVLEERHSLSIAETKKRRASVYCDGNLFIPKELARSELLQRRHSSAVNTLDQISRNRDYCIRMLKFPVGLGRARFVAQQLRKKKSNERKVSTDMEPERNVSTSKSELSIKVEPLSMPNLDPEHADKNQLCSDDECSIVLEDIVDANMIETEDDGTDELIDRVSKRQMKRALSLDSRLSKDNEIPVEVQGQESLPLYRWHVPDCNDNSIKMGLMEDLRNPNLSVNAKVQVGFSEVDTTLAVALTDQQVEAVEEVPQAAAIDLGPQLQQEPYHEHQQQHLRTPSPAAVQSDQRQQLQHQPYQEQQQQHLPSPNPAAIHHQQQQRHTELHQIEHTMDAQIQQQQTHLQRQVQQNVATAPSQLYAATSRPQSVQPQVGNLPLREHLRQRLLLPRIHTEQFPQTNSSNINAVNHLPQDLSQNFLESVLPSELHKQWRKQHYEEYTLTRAAPHQQQLSHRFQQQQPPPVWHQQYLPSYQKQQQLDASREELKQLKEQYQSLKCQEDEKLKSINKTLKDVYADRLLSERQHADYHRKFMHKMVESRKQEESLQTQKEQIRTQLKAGLDKLEQRISEKRRQLLEHNRTWHWQQQPNHQQQHEQLQLQQHQQLQQQQHQQLQQHPQQQQHQQQQHYQQQHQQLQQQQQQQLYPNQFAFNEHQQQQHQQFLFQLQPPAYQPRLQCFQDAFSQYSEARVIHSPTVQLHSGPPPAYRAENMQPAESNAHNDCRIIRHRHTIDHRANNVIMYARQSSRRTHATATSVLPAAALPPQHFALPETTRISSERAQMNQTIEQTAITSIISNYVTNYLNDMESRNPRNI